MVWKNPSTRLRAPETFPAPEWSPSPNEAAYYLAAIIDGEGHVDYQPQRKRPNRRILIANTEPDIIGAVLACCAILDISAYVYANAPSPGRRQAWEINVTGQRSLRRAAELLPIRSQRKAERLAAIAGSYSQTPQGSGRYSGTWPEARRRGTEAYRLHTEEGLSWSKIGARLAMTGSAACSAARRVAERAELRWPTSEHDAAAARANGVEALRLRSEERLSWPAVGKRLGMTDSGARQAAKRAARRGGGANERNAAGSLVTPTSLPKAG